ncbi:MAG: ABC transporter substrate binding protein [Sulfuricella sp.]|nr:ABC transporter substrate binding protein [Sulfuricella sp.]
MTGFLRLLRRCAPVAVALAALLADGAASGAPASPPVVARSAANSAHAIAVIYPDIGEPYRSVFTRIIEGVEDTAKSRVVSIPVGMSVNTQDLAAELRRQDIKVVIALGRHGLLAAAGLDRNVGVVAAGVLSVPEAEARATPVFSLSPDPALLFARLKNLLPGTRRVHVVYDPRQSGWLIRLARQAARTYDIELLTYEADDLKTAAVRYRELLASADPRRDAVWLPQDSTTVDETSILPMVLQESWNRGLPVFSSSVSHVKRGALFSLYPDNVELGRNLGNVAQGYLSNGVAGVRGIVPLREVLAAVNVRTASHLGLDLTSRRQNFDLIFPEP